jgi:pimeloyl-ACP methyl ester carboxylesterase
VTRLAALTAASALLLAPAAADAAARFRPCAGNDSIGCASVRVPLDRSRPSGSKIRLHVERWPGIGRRRPGALVLLAGGPGQSATATFDEDYVASLPEQAVRGRDLAVFDQRGTGRSGALRCPRFERVVARSQLSRETAEAERCANDLGSRRSHYTTRNAVGDLESVRKALGVRKLSLLGVSYGTKLALAYARRYPSRVERIVLDSVLATDAPDLLARQSFRVTPRALGDLCAAGACAGISSDPGADLAALVRRIAESGPIAGDLYGGDGRPRRESVTRADLWNAILQGDIDPAARAATPAAVQSALRGDPAPLVRLVKPIPGALAGYASEPLPFSYATFAATTCEDGPLPWDRTTPPGDRPAQAAERVAAMPDSEFGPFDRATALETEPMNICERWPVLPREPVLGGEPSPRVPALLLSGRDDVRTPVEEARRVAAALPRSTVIEVPARGHGTIGVRCVRRSLAVFFAGRTPSTACGNRREEPPAPIAPTALDQVAPAAGTDGVPGRTVAAIRLTLDDVRRFGFFVERGGGLRGGRFAQGEDSLRLSNVVFVPGVLVSGTLSLGTEEAEWVGTLRVSGDAAADGELTIRRDGSVTGVLDGQRVSSPAP